ncbi:isoprenylcysteine carboxylmethyltransferase family protein [Pseudaminobacter sp. 19-2017]|uniref:Isoprenylcysteine carboxylmethyltransferase family protein n=1 Tax=Pseudaminobacter soli (ex Zhang et al. 2022) TaxID=2831468 RepID=A0A942I8Y9_9HYPH|nr:protein-S-isoprenylcysteine O-methyltransferase [Pseudaminobacter soli]MBS3649835.1 isoprenylcysteine carboxylmethyltransferase family protein [Pseudaminobacter soli]
MSISTALAAKIVWLLGIVAWYVIRYPFERRAKRVRVVTDRRSLLDRVGLVSAVLGMAVLPAIYVFTGFPDTADYPARWWAVVLGAAIVVAGLWTFRRSHKELGRNWSITLEIRDEHRLISSGPYALVRHPMYTSFFLIALGQLFLLPNWFAGPIGLVGFAVLFFVRVAKEERMMLETFGPQYTTYMGRTKRLIPYIY